MSVTLTGNPLIIASGDAGTGVIVSSQFRVQAIAWDPVSAIANSDAIAVKDKLGVVKYSRTYTTGDLINDGMIVFPQSVIFNGLIVSALTRGTLYIYLTDNNNLVA